MPLTGWKQVHNFGDEIPYKGIKLTWIPSQPAENDGAICPRESDLLGMLNIRWQCRNNFAIIIAPHSSNWAILSHLSGATLVFAMTRLA